MPRATPRWAGCRLTGWQLEAGRHPVANPQKIKHRPRGVRIKRALDKDDRKPFNLVAKRVRATLRERHDLA